MDHQSAVNYQRIEQAIAYIRENYKAQPSLESIAASVYLSPTHFQRIFTDWAGVSPKKFLQYLNVKYAKQLLKQEQATLFDATNELGLSSTSRLHDLFIKIEGMTPSEFKQGAEGLSINYSTYDSPFGAIIVASTRKGICYLAFLDEEGIAKERLLKLYPKAKFQEQADEIQAAALPFFNGNWENLPLLKLHLRATPFQLKVWEALLRIPFGGLSTYGKIANDIAQPKASRAVGTAVGSNPIAYLIPCHRVIRSSGITGNYLWGANKKSAMIGWEAIRSGKF